MKKRFIVQKPEKSLRAFLKETLEQQEVASDRLSGKAIKALIDQGCCFIDGKLEKFGSKALTKGAVVELHLPDPASHQQTPKSSKEAFDPQAIVYQDEHLLIYNKPCGLVCSPQAITEHFSERLYLVHRLDKATSGALILAKTKAAQEALEDLFRDRMVEKVYTALVEGNVEKSQHKKEGTIKSYLIKKGSFDGQTIYGSNKAFSQDQEGKEAITHWKVLSEKEGKSLIECRPKTGRTHQIRVHMQELGHPILGDIIYARQSGFYPRMMLHASKVAFEHPFTGILLEVSVPSSHSLFR